MIQRRATWKPGWHIGTTGLLVILVFAFLGTAFDTLLQTKSITKSLFLHPFDVIFYWGAFDTLHVEPWRAVTANFLHFGLFHLLINAKLLTLVGPSVDKIFSPLVTLSLFIVLGTTAMLFSASLGQGGVIIGASNGIMGLLGVAMGYAYFHGRYHMAKNFFLWGFSIILLSFILSELCLLRTDNTGHIVGIILGTFVSWVFYLLEKRSHHLLVGLIWFFLMVTIYFLFLGLEGFLTLFVNRI